jgi:hypothetical protein
LGDVAALGVLSADAYSLLKSEEVFFRNNQKKMLDKSSKVTILISGGFVRGDMGIAFFLFYTEGMSSRRFPYFNAYVALPPGPINAYITLLFAVVGCDRTAVNNG